MNTTELTIMKPANVQLITTNIPTAYNENGLSHQRCLDFGRKLMEEVKTNGMSDEMDSRLAEYIGRSRNTVKKMLDKRTPITKMFDELRSAFTSIENDVDPAKKGSIPYLLQQMRNEYAAKKREEMLKKQQEAILKQQAIQAKNAYKQRIEDEYASTFAFIMKDEVRKINEIFASVNIVNADKVKQRLEDFAPTFDPMSFACLSVDAPAGVPEEELNNLRGELHNRLMSQYETTLSQAVENELKRLLVLLPSKVAELEKIARASQEEGERMKLEMERIEKENAAKAEAERAQKQAEEDALRQQNQQKEQLNDLFMQQAVSAPEYTPNSKVKKSISITGVQGYTAIISLWWNEVGCKMSDEELGKIFKKQITYAEKVANDKTNPRFIKDENVTYIDSVTAK